jgi:hypothetical protein
MNISTKHVRNAPEAMDLGRKEDQLAHACWSALRNLQSHNRLRGKLKDAISHRAWVIHATTNDLPIQSDLLTQAMKNRGRRRTTDLLMEIISEKWWRQRSKWGLSDARDGSPGIETNWWQAIKMGSDQVRLKCLHQQFHPHVFRGMRLFSWVHFHIIGRFHPMDTLVSRHKQFSRIHCNSGVNRSLRGIMVQS